MKGKNVILVTTLFFAMVFPFTANSQILFGGHSLSLAYSPLSHIYRSTYLNYGRPYLEGAEINTWGKISGVIGFLIGEVDDHSKPAIAYNRANDTFLIVRTSTWPYHDLYGHFLDYTSPNFLEPDQFMISDAPGVQANPIITLDSVSGKFLVTWVDDRNIDGAAIYGQLISAVGELEGSEFVIVDGLSREYIGWGEYSKPYYSVAYDDTNQRFLVVCNPGESIFGQFINANGTLQGERFTILDPGDDYTPIEHTSVAYDGLNQRYLVVWVLALGPGEIVGQLVNADGMPFGTTFTIPWAGSNPSVAFDNVNQRFLVAWTSGVTNGQFVNPDGTPQGDRFSIFQKGFITHDDPPAIAFNPDCGNFLIASVARDYAEMKDDLWAIKSDISYTFVGDPCPSAILKVKMKGYGGKRKHISEAGMNCKKNICSGQYWPGSEINIDAWVDGKEAVATWTGCNAIEDNRCQITMDSDKNVTVKFTRAPRRRR